jgi:predicted nucleic acid-binding protein
MAGYLLDTSTLIALMNSGGHLHQPATDFLEALAAEDLTFVSPISLGELRSGVESVFAIKGQRPLTAAKTLQSAESYDLLTVDRHVAQAYGQLKAKMAARFLAKASARRAHLEDWIDNVTGARLNVNENDLWICAGLRTGPHSRDLRP